MPQLGCASDYQAVIHFKGGNKKFVTLPRVTAMDWERKLDDYGEAHVTLTKAQLNPECCRKLFLTEPFAHELSLYRAGELVWQGPVFTVEETRATITITARDMLDWLFRRRLVNDVDTGDTPANAVDVAAKVIREALADGGDDPNLIPFLKITNTGAPTIVRKTFAKTVRALPEVQDIARVGLDLLAIRRHIILQPDKQNPAYKPYLLREDHFLGDFEVRKLGAELTTRATVTGGPSNPEDPQSPPLVGEFGGPATGYGLVDDLSTSDRTTDAGTLVAIAAKRVGYGNPAPVTVTFPDNGQVSPRAPLTVHDLIPGRYIQTQIGSYCLRMQALMKINQVACQWSPTQAERIGVALIPKDVFDLPPVPPLLKEAP